MTTDNGQPPSGAGGARVAPRPNRGWLWYFSIVFLLTVIATTTLIVFNLRQQLKPEQLAAARQLWKEHGPKDYELRYTTKTGEEGRVTHYVVVVRGGKVQSLTLNKQQVLDRATLDPKAPLDRQDNRPIADFGGYGMEAMFNQIEDFLDKDSKPGQPRVYVRGVFDPQDGHLLRYVRSVMSGRERLEIVVDELKPLDGKPTKGS